MPNRKELEKAKKKEQQYQEEIEKKAKEEYWSQGVNKREQKKTMENRMLPVIWSMAPKRNIPIMIPTFSATS